MSRAVAMAVESSPALASDNTSRSRLGSRSSTPSTSFRRCSTVMRCDAAVVIEAHVGAAPPNFKERDRNHVLGKLPRRSLAKGVAEHSICVAVVDLREPVRISVERSKPPRVIGCLCTLDRGHIKNCPLVVPRCTILLQPPMAPSGRGASTGGMPTVTMRGIGAMLSTPGAEAPGLSTASGEVSVGCADGGPTSRICDWL